MQGGTFGYCCVGKMCHTLSERENIERQQSGDAGEGIAGKQRCSQQGEGDAARIDEQFRVPKKGLEGDR